jgi:hypothetical protein
MGLLLLAALGLLSLRCEKEGYHRLLLVRGPADGSGVGSQQVETFSEDEFLLTYEIRRQTTAEAHSYRQPVTLVGTNSCYGHVLGYRMRSGSFFTKASWQSQSREVVLNETAAFQIFGSFEVAGFLLRIDRQNWLVVGVIEDQEADAAFVYVPSSATGGNGGDFMVLLDGALVNADYAKNALKQLGIYENSSSFVDLAAASAVFKGRFTVALGASFILLIFFLIRFSAGWLYRRLPVYRALLRDVYLRELLATKGKDILKTVLAGFGCLAGLAALLTLGLQILAECLKWQGVIPGGHTWIMGSFGAKLAWLYDYHLWGQIIFILLLVILLSVWIQALRLTPADGSVKKGATDDTTES